jgi:dolichol-phosphate mannosyltransferase
MPNVATDFSIVLPAYREEENLRLLLPRVVAIAAALPGPAEVLVVDTLAPLDSSAEVCREVGARLVARGPTNCYGDAVRTGIREARGRFVLFMDADGSHAPELIPTLVSRLPEADVVIASRYVEGGHTENTLPLIVMSRLVNLTYSVVLGLKCKDVSNSFKLYRGELLRELSLGCDNFDVIEEILFKIRRAHPAVRIVEVPATFRKRMFGETKRNLFLFMLSYVFTLIRLRFSHRAPGPAPAGPRPGDPRA